MLIIIHTHREEDTDCSETVMACIEWLIMELAERAFLLILRCTLLFTVWVGNVWHSQRNLSSIIGNFSDKIYLSKEREERACGTFYKNKLHIIWWTKTCQLKTQHPKDCKSPTHQLENSSPASNAIENHPGFDLPPRAPSGCTPLSFRNRADGSPWCRRRCPRFPAAAADRTCAACSFGPSSPASTDRTPWGCPRYRSCWVIWPHGFSVGCVYVIYVRMWYFILFLPTATEAP